MRILIAPDSFKGSLTARQAADAMRDGILQAMPRAEIMTMPMADGGEGTVDVLLDNLGGTRKTVQVLGPLGDPVEASYGILADGSTGVMEMAAASGLTLISEKMRNPLLTSTYGTGQVIRALLAEGCQRIIIGIGGSATNDCGAGMAAALGVEFLDDAGNSVFPAGGNLNRIVQICTEQVDPRLKNTEILVACDVDNPLLGPQGAAYVYGPQKGATPEMVKILDSNLAYFHQGIKEVLHMDVAELPGAGAAGGLGAGLMVFAGGRFVSGVELLMDMVNFEQALSQADFLCTGEGRLDLQTLRGKVVAGMVKKAVWLGVPTFIFAGELAGDTRWTSEDLVVPFCIAEGPMEREMMMKDASRLLGRTAARVFRTVHIAARRMRSDD